MKKIITFIFIVLLVIAGIYYFYNKPSSTGSTVKNIDTSKDTTSNLVSDANSKTTKTIMITAEKFQYTPSVIKVKKGDKVKIIIDNKDTTHGINIPDFNVKGIDSVEFIADKTGTFEFRCPTFCGEGHREMTGTLIVED